MVDVAASEREWTRSAFDARVLAALRSNLYENDFFEIISRVPADAESSIELMKIAVSSHDFDLARRAAHALMGMSSNFGAVRLAAIADYINSGCGGIDEVSSQIEALEQALQETREG